MAAADATNKVQVANQYFMQPPLYQQTGQTSY